MKGSMVMKVKPMGMLLMMLAGWIDRHQMDVIADLKEEKEIQREKLGAMRILLNDNRWTRPARLGGACGAFSRDMPAIGEVLWLMAKPVKQS